MGCGGRRGGLAAGNKKSCCGGRSAVDLAAVSDLQHQHNHFIVLDVADQPVVTHPIAP